MKKNLLFVSVVALTALFFSSCSSPNEPKGGGGTQLKSTVTGYVIRSDDRSKVPNAFVYDTRGSQQDTTKADGSFTLTYQLTSSYSGTLVATRNTFGNDTLNFTLPAGANDTLSTSLVLVADSTSQKTGSGAGIIASIVLVGGGDPGNIAIRGTGFAESSLLTFEARDSLGIAVGGVNKSTLYFSLLGGPGGGEYVFPVSGVTDLSGRVSTRVTSGTKAGVIQIFAYAKPDTANPNFIVKSSPVRLTISGGLPDSAHFSMSATTFNIAGMLFDNLRANFGVIIGDNQGNPVRAGTAVYFNTNAGIIQPSATTDANGTASVTLISGNPRPLLTGGRVTVTATTIGDSGKILRQSMPIIFSGATVITPPVGNFTIPDSGSYSFAYSVSDANGNPIVGKSTINVTVTGPGSGDLELSGDVDVTVPDAIVAGAGTTQFSVKMRDKTRGGANGLVYVSIKVTTDAATGNGNATSTFAGYQIGSAGGGVGGFGVRQPSIITLDGISPSNGNLSVRGTGSNESAHLTFTVRDSSGSPVADPLGLAPKIYVTFSNSPNIGGGEYIYPPADSTNDLGQVSTTFNSGTRSGVIQITAQTVSGGRTVLAAPVALTIAGGLPDSNHFTPTLSKVNMPGLVKTGALGTINVLVGDSAGNPAQSGTKLYFSTTGGVVTASAVTDQNGQATASLQGGFPAPNDLGPGRGHVTVATVGKGGILVTKQLPFLFSGAPIIYGPASGFVIADSGQYSFNYKVADLNGNPLSQGATIAVTASGAGSGSLSLKGDAARTLPDTKDTAYTNFSVLAQDNSGPAGTVTFTISVNGDNGSTSYSWSGTKLAKGAVVGGGGAGYASSILLVGATPAPPGPISVKGTGSTETAVIQFQVKDSLGNPLDPTRAANITFTI
ncbi:MAG TPA: Ig-like domain-containing protein, partial [Bacteroidota bacterium]|nr:Ig-like domain-containing protein [Bacteroidota bacterium]